MHQRPNAPRLIIDYVDSQAIRRNPHSARKYSPRQIASLVKSIDHFGLVSPFLVDENQVLIAGHALLEAAIRLDIKEVPVVVVSHLDEADKRALALGLNRLAELGDWDQDKLRSALQFLIDIDIDFDFSIIGFETPEIDVLLDTSASAAAGDALPDGTDGLPAVSQLCDLWNLGDHSLYCGNALEKGSYDAVIGQERAKAVITDPPYNVPIDGHVRTAGSNHRDFAMASGEMSPEAFTEFLTKSFRLQAAASVDGALHYVFMDWRHIYEILVAGKDVYCELKNLVVWNKTTGGMGSFYRSQHELVFVFKSGKAAYTNNINLGVHGRYRTNVWDYPGINVGPNRSELLALHPTVKPVALIADAIRDCTKRGDLILDPFSGSGTVLIAAEKTKRRAAAIEIDPLYVDAAIRRWQAYTGKPAVHRLTGKTFAEKEPAAAENPATADAKNDSSEVRS